MDAHAPRNAQLIFVTVVPRADDNENDFIYCGRSFVTDRPLQKSMTD